MMSLNGWGYCYLAGAIRDERWPHCPVSIEARKDPIFRGEVSDFLRQYPELEIQMSNRVKICPRCSKSCGMTLLACNNCSFDISFQPVERSDNALMGFIYGLEPFPTSIRYESENFLVYDDLMQTTVIHLNSIPTNVYIPDFRYLFSNPEKGLEIIRNLFEAACQAAVGMLANDNFRDKYFSTTAHNMINEIGLERFVKENVLCGFNYPPSQCQLHLQFILPPYVPYHAVLLATGKHSEMERFFVYEYVKECLEQLVSRRIKLEISEIRDLNGRELIALMKSIVNADYYYAYHKAIRLHKKNENQFSNWNQNDFEFVIVDRRIVLPVSVLDGREAIPANQMKVSDLVKQDRITITSYGKGLGMQYYTYAKNPGQVQHWEDTIPIKSNSHS